MVQSGLIYYIKWALLILNLAPLYFNAPPDQPSHVLKTTPKIHFAYPLPPSLMLSHFWMPLYAAVVVEGHQEPSHEDNDAAIFITESKPTDIREPKL